MSILVVIASIHAKPEKEAVLRALVQSLVAPTLAEEGCLRYELNEADDGKSWMITEQWTSHALWEKHMDSPQLGRFKAASDELVERFELFTGKPL
jgi:quinol monooxygenase YgiN